MRSSSRRFFLLIFFGAILIFCATIPFALKKINRPEPLEKYKLPVGVQVVFRNDDLSNENDLKTEGRLISFFSAFHANQIYAIIPKLNNGNYFYTCKPLTDSLTDWLHKGYITPSIHGYTHQFNRNGEFKGLPVKIQDSLMLGAKNAFRKVFNSPLIFCPPWNLMDRNTVEICKSYDIRIISGFRGEPVVDSMCYFNANLNLFSGELPSVQDLIREDIVRFKNTILVILYHSAYDFVDEDDFQVLGQILHDLQFKYNSTFTNMDTMISRYPEYLHYVNALGLNYKTGMRQKQVLTYIGFNKRASLIERELSDCYNRVFTGDPMAASACLIKRISKTSWLTSVIFFGIGMIVFMLILTVAYIVQREYRSVPKFLRILTLIGLSLGCILQYSIFADRPKWQIILQIYIYVMIGILIPLFFDRVDRQDRRSK